MIDVVACNLQYRGMDRGISVEHFNSKKAFKNFDSILQEYFLYLERSDFQEGGISWENILSFYNILVENEVDCEIIAYDNKRIYDVYNHKVELLGIDIVKEMCESLIYYSEEWIDKSCLNENGLCRNIESVNEIVEQSGENQDEWKPCWVYKVIV